MSEQLDYVRQLEAQIATAQSALDKLKAERDEALLAAQHEEIENLEQYLDRAHISLQDLSAAAEDAWHDLKETLEQLMAKVGHSLKQLLGEDDDSAE